jgi:hypothetical protein
MPPIDALYATPTTHTPLPAADATTDAHRVPCLCQVTRMCPPITYAFCLFAWGVGSESKLFRSVEAR